ncbi:reverse transcriptase domain-containing protein [Galbibacter sp. EGI 63066]|uniref:reverse transcriptase domain-containing protein n=1 Tax=Galbibacter sp. EGI 63066 TaxID=2993559 RepID=UPI0022499D3C|nr:reverse transcriptase domain-containing protein [Galbibacter sp. EGI 63066]MCX2680266.1 reverse transcriptase domain-containing protein [Galbibacter sp. EGI 63066]
MSKKEIFKKENLEELFKENFDTTKTKGIDKLNAIGFQNRKKELLNATERKIYDETYTFSPYVEVLKLKGRNKHPRIISIPTVRDRIILFAVKEYLHDLFPDSINKKLPNSFIRDIKKYFSINGKKKYFLKIDITKYYDTINRELLLQKLKDKGVDNFVLRLIKNAIETPTVPQNTKKSKYHHFETKKGVPQGLSISNILAQIYMEEIDEILNKRKYFYSRYVDDILILNDDPISKYRFKNVEKEIKKINLELNNSKTEFGKVSDGFIFLSYSISDKKISIAEKNVQLFIRRIAGKFTWLKNGLSNKHDRPKWLKDDKERFKEVFLEELNEMITGIISKNKKYGWLFYFAEMNDKSLLFKLDKIIDSFFKALKVFDNKPPKNLKKLVRSYHVIRFDSNKNYLANYDEIDTVRKKREFLVFRGEIGSEIPYTNDEIDDFFERFTKKTINKLEKDLGYKY